MTTLGQLQVEIPGRKADDPVMTQEEFQKGTQIYFERCAGCHGVLRKGATGKPLTTDHHAGKRLQTTCTASSPTVRLRACRTGARPARLSEEDVDLMARYLLLEPPAPPEWGMPEMQNSAGRSWSRPKIARPRR